MAGKYDKFWEMTEGGPYDKGEEVFKCEGCGAITCPEDGWNGEPEPGLCSDKCREGQGDWKPGAVSKLYKKRIAEMFPNAPGAGI